MFNPDYPVDDGASFLMHTYQKPEQTSMYWNGGYSGMSMSMPYNDPTSRRNFNPVNPFQQWGQGQPQQPFQPFQPQNMQFGTNANNTGIPENMVQPFGTYPPSGPQQPNMNGLNSFIDSRRNMNNPVQVSQNNPWATPVAPTQDPNANAFQQQPYSNPFATQPMYGYDQNYYGNNGFFKVDMSTAALYNNSGSALNKNNAWDNYFTQYRPLPQPQNINWRPEQQYQQSPFTLQAPQPYAMPQYPVQQYSVPQNWNDIAEKNWQNI